MTCPKPPTRSARLRSRSLGSENSSPTVKSRSATPISAKASTSSTERIQLRAWGPKSAPATTKPATEGS